VAVDGDGELDGDGVLDVHAVACCYGVEVGNEWVREEEGEFAEGVFVEFVDFFCCGHVFGAVEFGEGGGLFGGGVEYPECALE